MNISALAVLPEALLQLLCPYFIAATESWTKTQCQLVLASCSGANFVGLVFFKAKFRLLLNKLPVKRFYFFFNECRLWLIIFKGQMENKSGREAFILKLAQTVLLLSFGPPTSGFRHKRACTRD